MKKIKLSDVTLAMVKNSQFGCRNCLWNCVECEKGSKFQPDIYNNKPTCKGYSYFD